MKRRTSLITAAAVGGALLAGTGAIAANIGVLATADDNSIGNLSADAPVETPPATVEGQVIDIYIEDPPTTTSTVTSTTVPAAAGDSTVARQFAVEDIGTVTVQQTPEGLFLAAVHATDGWNWSAAQSGADGLTVTFASGETTYEFHAAVGADGLIEARVDQPIVNVVQTPSPAAASSASSGSGRGHDDDHDEYEGHDDDEYEDDDDHEGGDDDD